MVSATILFNFPSKWPAFGILSNAYWYTVFQYSICGRDVPTPIAPNTEFLERPA